MTEMAKKVVGFFRAGDRVLVGDRRATVLGATSPTIAQTEERRYALKFDDGTDGEVGAADLDDEAGLSVLNRLGDRGFQHRHGGGQSAAIWSVAQATDYVRHNETYPENLIEVPVIPELDDVMDALSLIRAERERLDRHERTLLAAARKAGATWLQIGLVQGHPHASAKQASSKRWKSLGGPEWEQKITSPRTAG